ncbi:MAG: hypothetical protein AB7F67_24640, partial [Rhodospirillaceae bacterium]
MPQARPSGRANAVFRRKSNWNAYKAHSVRMEGYSSMSNPLNGADMASLSALPARQRLASRLLACTAVGLAGAAISASAAAQT